MVEKLLPIVKTSPYVVSVVAKDALGLMAPPTSGKIYRSAMFVIVVVM